MTALFFNTHWLSLICVCRPMGHFGRDGRNFLDYYLLVSAPAVWRHFTFEIAPEKKNPTDSNLANAVGHLMSPQKETICPGIISRGMLSDRPAPSYWNHTLFCPCTHWKKNHSISAEKSFWSSRAIAIIREVFFFKVLRRCSPDQAAWQIQYYNNGIDKAFYRLISAISSLCKSGHKLQSNRTRELFFPHPVYIYTVEYDDIYVYTYLLHLIRV